MGHPVPQLHDAIVMIMTWTALRTGDRLASMADAIAETVKITSAQLDANSVTGGYGSGF